MKKKVTTLAVAAGLLGSVLTATEAVAADPAPTGVTVAWKDSTHKFVRVTWTEDGDRPNTVVVQRPDGTQPTVVAPKYVAAGAPDEAEFAASELAPFSGTVHIGVAAGTAAGATSPFAASPGFDTIRAGFAERVSFTLSGSSAVHVKWKLYPSSEQDVTPNDPLDLTGTTLYQPQVVVGDKVTPLAAPSTATEFGFTGPLPPYRLEVVTSNEWGTWSAPVVYAERSGLKATIPTWVKSGTSGSQPAITGTVVDDRIPIILQARNSATSPWYVVASQLSYRRAFRFELGAAGSRQYRVQAANSRNDSGGRAYFGGYSPTVAMTVQNNPYGVYWNPSVIKRGQTSTASLFRSPSPSGTVILQRWTGTTWSTVGPVYSTSGVARGYVKGAAPGRVAYRFYLPAVTVNGMWYAAAYSANFVLTTI